jgi:hypothetical protein
MDNMQDFLSTHSNPSGALNWFDYFYGETIPKRRFKPRKELKRFKRIRQVRRFDREFPDFVDNAIRYPNGDLYFPHDQGLW